MRVKPDGLKRRYIGHLLALASQLLSHADAHEVAVGVVDQDAIPDVLAVEYLIGSQTMLKARVGPGDRIVGNAIEPVTDPARAGGHDDDLRAVVTSRIGLQ